MKQSLLRIVTLASKINRKTTFLLSIHDNWTIQLSTEVRNTQRYKQRDLYYRILLWWKSFWQKNSSFLGSDWLIRHSNARGLCHWDVVTNRKGFMLLQCCNAVQPYHTIENTKAQQKLRQRTLKFLEIWESISDGQNFTQNFTSKFHLEISSRNFTQNFISKQLLILFDTIIAPRIFYNGKTPLYSDELCHVKSTDTKRHVTSIVLSWSRTVRRFGSGEFDTLRRVTPLVVPCPSSQSCTHKVSPFFI